MAHYNVTIISNFNTVEFESTSRNSIKHLRNNGGNRCIVRKKDGSFVSGAAYSDELGFYHINEY